MNKHTAGGVGTQPWTHRFGELPAIREAIYAVNSSVPTDLLLEEASFLVDAMAETAVRGNDSPAAAAQAWMLESNLRRLQALLGCVEAQLARAKLDSSGRADS